MEAGLIIKHHEPFSVRLKQFWELPMSRQLLGEKFAKQLLHEPDGLIFQPAKEVNYVFFLILLSINTYNHTCFPER